MIAAQGQKGLSSIAERYTVKFRNGMWRVWDNVAYRDHGFPHRRGIDAVKAAAEANAMPQKRGEARS